MRGNKHQRREQWQWSVPERESNHFIIVLLELLLEVWSESIRRIFPTSRGSESDKVHRFIASKIAGFIGLASTI